MEQNKKPVSVIAVDPGNSDKVFFSTALVTGTGDSITMIPYQKAAEGVEIKGVHLKSSKCSGQGGCGNKGCRNAKD